MAPLNPQAPAFKPTSFRSSAPIDVPSAEPHAGLPEDPWALSSTEMSVSPAELEELEQVEEWVNLMAELEGMEQDHLIELSLRHADKHKIAQIKAAAASKHHHHKGHKHSHHKSAAKA